MLVPVRRRNPDVDWSSVRDWIRDLDWGNVPGWITALTAVVVGAYAIVNVRTARKAYEDGKWIDEVATARLV
jgi:hypothetical protein